MKASILYESNCILGEGATWHSGRKSFFWVDIKGKTVYEYNWQNKETHHRQIPYQVSLIIETENKNKILLGVQGGLIWLTPDTGKIDWLMDIEKSIPTNRTNDGACDTQGRLWIGTMDNECKPGLGALYCIDKNLLLQKKLEHLSIPNGIAWPQANNKMYHIDTTDATVKSYSFDASTGNISLEKIAINVPSELGSPDGMCIDEEGMLWIAHWGGYGVYRWDPETGKILDKLELPVPHVTSCAFGGEDLHELIITTAREGLTAEQLDKYPESGNVFIATPGIKGIARNKFFSPN